MPDAVLITTATSVIVAVATLWKAAQAAKHTKPNGAGTVPSMLEHLIDWSGTVDRRLDSMSERLNRHIDGHEKTP